MDARHPVKLMTRLCLCLVFALSLCTPALWALSSPNVTRAYAADGDNTNTTPTDPDSTRTLVKMNVGYTGTDGKAVWDDGNPQIAEKGATLDLLCRVTWSDESAGYAGDEGVALTWVSSDDSVATVARDGTITAKADGSVTITCTATDTPSVTATIDISVVGQEGVWATGVEVTDANQTPYGDNRINFDTLNDTLDLYATVYYSDGTSKSTVDGPIANLTWSTSDSAAAAIDEITGKIASKDDSTGVKAIATVTGGLGGASVYGYAWVVINSGKYADNWMPSDTLTVKVVYEADYKDDVDKVYKEKTYSVSDVSALGTESRTYTLIRGANGYFTASATGVTIQKFLDDMGLVGSEIKEFRFSALDGANPGAMSYSSLMGTTGYYYPNFSLGGSDNGRQAEPPMLALTSQLAANTDQPDSSSMTEGTRFRLMAGARSTTDSGSAMRSIMYVSTMTIVMTGNAPVEENSGDPPTNGGGGGGGGSNGTDGSGTGSTGAGAGSGSGAGAGGVGIGAGASTAASTFGISTDASSGGSESGVAGSAGDDNEGVDTSSDATTVDTDTGVPWQAYQIMKKQLSDIPQSDTDNAAYPFALPAILVALATGVASTILRYRRELV